MKQTILITGSTDGIGKLAALQLAAAGHTVYIHGRKAEKLTNVIAEIKAASGNSNVDGFVADFSDLAAVRQMAEQVKQVVPTLDVLINNAGVFKTPILRTKEGWDVRFVVNYFAPYVLTNELLPLLRNATAARILNVSSAAQLPISDKVLQGQMQESDMQAYAQSKLALTMWSFHLAKSESGIVTIAVNPGSLLNTNMVREAFGRHQSSADKGATILYELATLEAHASASGQYFDNDKGAFGPAHADAYDAEKVNQVLAMTAQVLSA